MKTLKDMPCASLNGCDNCVHFSNTSVDFDSDGDAVISCPIYDEMSNEELEMDFEKENLE